MEFNKHVYILKENRPKEDKTKWNLLNHMKGLLQEYPGNFWFTPSLSTMDLVRNLIVLHDILVFSVLKTRDESFRSLIKEELTNFEGIDMNVIRTLYLKVSENKLSYNDEIMLQKMIMLHIDWITETINFYSNCKPSKRANRHYGTMPGVAASRAEEWEAEEMEKSEAWKEAGGFKLNETGELEPE